MQSDSGQIEQLLQRYLRDELSREEVQELLDYILQHPALAGELLDRDRSEVVPEKFLNPPALPTAASKRMYERLITVIRNGGINTEEETTQVRRMAPRWRWIAAAVVALITITAAYFWQSGKGKQKQQIAHATIIKDALPGKTGAVLTLADGSHVVLDSAGNQQIVQQGNVQITNQHGQLTYSSNHKSAGESDFNILTTPAARQYKLVLPDGSKVWLNAGSSIRYPVTFKSKIREVEINGEVYFEVAHNATKPFRVKTGNIIIEDIGTAFNINAYGDEPVVKTTLVEGSIRLHAGSNNKILRPGMQGSVQQGGSSIAVNNVDVDEIIAWKEGLFNFNNLDIETVMRQIGRWYNMQIIYEGRKPEGQFSGIIDRNTNLAFILKSLEYSGMRFKVETSTDPAQMGKITVLK
ncbi:FecR domain-containing protein [Chitinophaga sp.]|uniref:FecR domain-containing protein n=1 Tax=Chitinophaga sp. TaxID=1869181 RepID=UPI002F92DFEA